MQTEFVSKLLAGSAERVGTTSPRGPKGSPVGEGQGTSQSSLSEATRWAKIKEISQSGVRWRKGDGQ